MQRAAHRAEQFPHEVAAHIMLAAQGVGQIPGPDDRLQIRHGVLDIVKLQRQLVLQSFHCRLMLPHHLFRKAHRPDFACRHFHLLMG